jgi:hypothetical protein
LPLLCGFHLGIGRAHARTDITCLIHSDNATVIHPTTCPETGGNLTCEILGEYTLDPSHGYQRKNE